jgi:hydrogenase nickel incorporation protein HypA/HybF
MAPPALCEPDAMHETAIAADLVELACRQITEGGGRILAVNVRVGVWAGVAAEALASAYQSAIAATPLAGSRLKIETTSLVIWCAQCAAERTIPRPQPLHCPVCGQRAAKVISGTELELVSLEISDDAQNS